MLNKLKKKISSVINPIAFIFIKLRISPNQVTFIGFLISIFSAYMFYLNNLILGSILLLLAGFFDILDGAIARLSNRVTKWGGVLDSFL
ncbi:MAG: CDP-alcohol phosphatidyltransferase family protein, partial [Candidatus Methanomethylicaceae archaeon]